MYKPYQRTMTAAAILLYTFASTLAAADIDQLSRIELKDKWGQVLFCQQIYKMPEVMPRLYDFDTEQCDSAALLVGDLASKHSTQEQQILKAQAENHAIALSYNTSEPYLSVPACRQFCLKLHKLREERINAGSR